MIEGKLPVDQWLALHKDAAKTINPETAEVWWDYAYVIDPYGVHEDLHDEEKCVGRVYFARAPGSDIPVWFGDLPTTVRDALWTRVHSMA
jgi:hypothetical protein